MPTVYDLSREELSERLVAWGEPSFRAEQVYSQLWKRAATYDQMSDVSPALRERLAEELPLGVEIITERTADRGATRKALLRLGGTHVIEAVLMGYRDRVTVCVSSQVGCAMGCGFCATGQMGLESNLSAGEIAAQVVWARREAARLPASTPQRLSNVVFMGMGEVMSGYLLPSQRNLPSARTEFVLPIHLHTVGSVRHNLSHICKRPFSRQESDWKQVHTEVLLGLAGGPPSRSGGLHTICGDVDLPPARNSTLGHAAVVSLAVRVRYRPHSSLQA